MSSNTHAGAAGSLRSIVLRRQNRSCNDNLFESIRVGLDSMYNGRLEALHVVKKTSDKRLTVSVVRHVVKHTSEDTKKQLK